MKSIVSLVAESPPQLIPDFKKPERKLLSVFMALLEIVPEFRGEFFRKCGFASGKTCQYRSFMEPHYDSPNLPNRYPDGLVTCVRGNSIWSAFIEAKAENNKIRPEQIQEYADLASRLEIETVISISNEYAREPTELPYHLAGNKRKSRKLFHFSWPEIRTSIGLFVGSTNSCNEAELAVLQHAFNFMSSERSGVATFDAMPKNWKNFVESANTALGFSTNTSGVMDIVYGWQQERRDLCAKLNGEVGGGVELRHPAGARATWQECTAFDKRHLANDYRLMAGYFFKRSKCLLQILSDLRACSHNLSLEIKPPNGKKAKGAVSWLASKLDGVVTDQHKIVFIWPGRGNDTEVDLETLFRFPETIFQDQKDGPKSIMITSGYRNVRRFKSQKQFIEDLEKTALQLIQVASLRGFLDA